MTERTTLASRFPELVEQWHPTKNGILTPQDVAPFSNKKVWWVCEKDHEWRAAVNNRSRGARCPYCTGRYLDPEKSLQALYPTVAEEWHPTLNGLLQPTEVAAHSNRKVYWLCDKGHSWCTSISHRTGFHQTGCPYCNNNCLQTGINDAATLYPDLMEQVHPTKNVGKDLSHYSCTSKEYFVWRCEHGHEWTARIRQRTSGYGCPYCSGNRVTAGSNDLAARYPDLAMDWDIEKNGELRPNQMAKNSDAVVWWKCSVCGFSWQAMIWVRIRGHGCPACNRTSRTVPGINDLTTHFPWIAKEWCDKRNGDLRPEHVTQFSNRKVWWQCEKGHEWCAVVYCRTLLGSGCPICRGREARILELSAKRKR